MADELPVKRFFADEALRPVSVVDLDEIVERFPWVDELLDNEDLDMSVDDDIALALVRPHVFKDAILASLKNDRADEIAHPEATPEAEELFVEAMNELAVAGAFIEVVGDGELTDD